MLLMRITGQSPIIIYFKNDAGTVSDTIEIGQAYSNHGLSFTIEDKGQLLTAKHCHLLLQVLLQQ